ncbi:MAG: hypothetical protein WBF17_00130, partial [Phycisphaerae bacterium]
ADFSDMVAKFQADPSMGIEALEAALETAFGVSPSDLGLSMDTVGGEPAFRLDLTYSKDFAPGTTLPMNFDLSQLGVAGLSNLIDVHSAGELDVEGGVALTLSLGIDLSNPSSPRPFIYDTSGFGVTLGISGTNLQFETSLGALGIYVGSPTTPGMVFLDADGAGGSTSPASLSFDLTDNNGDGIHYFDEDILTNLTPLVTGQAEATLPIFFPTQGSQLTPDLHVRVTNLAEPITSFETLSTPNFGGIISALDFSTDTLEALVGGWSGILQLLELALSEQALGGNLPLVGDKLIEASRFIRYLREDVVSALEQKGELTALFVRQKVFDVLGPGGWNWLGDLTGDSNVTLDDVVMTVSPEGVEFNIKLASPLIGFEIPFDLDLGIPALGLDVRGEVSARVGFEFLFGFGVSRLDGVYFDVSDPEDMSVFFEVSLDSLDATGELLFLQLDAETLDPGDLTAEQLARTNGVVNAFHGAFSLDVTDPGTVAADGKMTLAELASVGSFADVVTAKLTADASIHLGLLASLGGDTNFPSVSANFHMYWGFGDTTEFDLVAPAIEFTDIHLNIGEFFSGLFGETLSVLNDIIDPVRPIIDALTAPIPLISDLAGTPISLVDIARLFGYGDVADYVEAVDTIADLLDVGGMGSDLWIDLGGFSLDGYNAVTDDPTGYDLSSATPDATASGFDLGGAIGGLGDGGLSSYFDSANHLNSGAKSDRLQFPFLSNPFSVLGLLMGQNMVIVTYDMPKFEIDFTYSQSFPIIGPLMARLTGRIGAWVDVAIGYDTEGFRRFAESGDAGDIFHGFFISDGANPDGSGEDVPEAQLYGSITASAELNLGIASDGAGGGVYASIDFNLHDNDGDGRVRADELWKNFLLGGIWVFDIGGKIELGLEAYVKFLMFEATFEIAKITLLEFELDRPADVPEPDTDPILASVDGSGLLTVHIGPNAAARVHGDLSDGDDVIYLDRGNSPEEVVVSGFGVQQRYQGVTGIYVDAGAGNDIITVDEHVTLPVEMWGGDGNDVLTSGDGPAELHGDDPGDAYSGIDRLYGGDAADHLWGQGGNDKLYGGFGDDVLYGDDGNDELYGSLGDDELHGGAGDDLLLGEADYDELYGDAGEDDLYGGRDGDILYGGDDDDDLFGERGQDTLYGEAGEDTLSGGLGNDSLYGGDDDDLIDGGRSNDIVEGGGGDDELYGGLGSDTIRGGDGDDTIYAGTSRDPGPGNPYYAGEPQSTHLIEGGEGSDIIYADLGDDVIHAGEGDNYVEAYAGNELITAGSGDDEIYGGEGDETINAGDGDNDVYGGPGSETVTTGSGVDLIDLRASGGAKEAVPHTIVSGAGIDTIHGDAGDDHITAGAGDDIIYGYDGENTVYAGGGDDKVYTGVNDDDIWGEDGDDIIHASHGDNYVDAGAGDDRVTSGDGMDVIHGRAGEDTLSSEGGDDEIYGQADFDEIHGGAGNDLLVGGTGDDELYGDAGDDILWGGAEAYPASSFDLDNTSNFELPPGYANAEAENPTGYTPPLMTPKVFYGDSFEGQPFDGEDKLYGGSGRDFLFGGEMTDRLEGGPGSDYVDGGVGLDTVFGDGGDDIMRGGSNDDRLYGGSGIDQVYGDDGNDMLYGDAGTGDNQAGQRLYGGAGHDDLHAYAPSTDVGVEGPKRGDELHGNSGNDWMYGNIRSEVMVGGTGNDNMFGDWLIGPEYAINPYADMDGGNDRMFGDTGEEAIYGGGGNDVIFGGGDSDTLEGQDGLDYLYGGRGIDFIVLDTNPDYSLFGEVFDGHYGTRRGGDTPDDNATDIMLIRGTQYSDTIILKESDVGISAPSDGPANGRLGAGQTAEFTLTFDGSDYVVAVSDDPVNQNLQHLVSDINMAMGWAGLMQNDVRAVRVGNRIRIQTVDQGRDAELVMFGTNEITRDVLGFEEGQFGVALLTVEFNGQPILANWRSTDGTPLVEQFRVPSGMGNDYVAFATGADAVDVTELSERSNDWVGVFDGGPGNDTLMGSDARDRLDGGIGSDWIYGFGGDDRLWGDTSNGDPFDRDRLYAGGGHDDLIGGLGTNDLMAWTLDPNGAITQLRFLNGQSAENESGPAVLVGTRPGPTDGIVRSDASFSLSIDGGQTFHQVALGEDHTHGNLNLADLAADLTGSINFQPELAGLVTAGVDGDRLTLSSTTGTIEMDTGPYGVWMDPATGKRYNHDGGGAWVIEDTGLNRILGQLNADDLYGGTCLDFLYGNGGDDRLFTRDGELFEVGYGIPAGDEWKAYARSTNKVWYYSGTGADDVISVDFVTEPGLLADHHLITRLTNNNGNYTFDAQVRLDFNATDDEGRYIWDPTDLLISLE